MELYNTTFFFSFFLFIESFSFFHSADLKRGKVGGLAEDHHHGHLDLPTPAIGSASRKGFPVMPPCPPSCQVDILLLVYLNGAARNPSAIDGGQKVSKGSLGRPFNRWVQAKVPLDLVSLRPSSRPFPPWNNLFEPYLDSKQVIPPFNIKVFFNLALHEVLSRHRVGLPSRPRQGIHLSSPGSKI